MKQISIPKDFAEKQAKDASFFYSEAWLNLITRLYKHPIVPLLTTNQAGQTTGFLPLCSVQSPLTGRRLIGLPYSDYYPLLASDDKTANDLIDQAIDLAQRQKVRYLELRTGPNEILAKRTDLVENNSLVRPLISLPGDPDTAWSNLRRTQRQHVKKSRELGVKVRVAQQREDVAHYYRLHVQTYCQKHGVLAQPAQFFYGMWDSLAADGKMQLLLAEYEGRAIAGMILLMSDNKTFRYAYGATDKRYLYLAANNLFMWTAIKWGCENGYQVLDMGSTARDDEGAMEFKRRWGAIPEPLPYYYYYPAAIGLVAKSEKSQTRHFLSSCWKHLPTAITGPLGGQLYRHMV
jgi:CelD/BcsL family acetyltransferase involved in cellulose biosynthesis